MYPLHFGMIRALEFPCGARRNSLSGGIHNEVISMRQDIHPDYTSIKATCSCGNVIETRSTICKDIHLDICSACHPFYTGTQKVVDTGGRIDKFNKRFGALTKSKK